MKIVILEHFVLEGQLDVARARIAQVGGRMAAQPGFLFRHVGPLESDPLCLTSVTGWENAQACASWNAALAKNPLAPAAAPVYRKVVTSEFVTEYFPPEPLSAP